MKYPERVQKILDKPEKDRTKSEKEYLNWYGATGPGAQIRAIARALREGR